MHIKTKQRFLRTRKTCVSLLLYSSMSFLPLHMDFADFPITSATAEDISESAKTLSAKTTKNKKPLANSTPLLTSLRGSPEKRHKNTLSAKKTDISSYNLDLNIIPENEPSSSLSENPRALQAATMCDNPADFQPNKQVPRPGSSQKLKCGGSKGAVQESLLQTPVDAQGGKLISFENLKCEETRVYVKGSGGTYNLSPVLFAFSLNAYKDCCLDNAVRCRRKYNADQGTMCQDPNKFLPDAMIGEHACKLVDQQLLNTPIDAEGGLLSSWQKLDCKQTTQFKQDGNTYVNTDALLAHSLVNYADCCGGSGLQCEMGFLEEMMDKVNGVVTGENITFDTVMTTLGLVSMLVSCVSMVFCIKRRLLGEKPGQKDGNKVEKFEDENRRERDRQAPRKPPPREIIQDSDSDSGEDEFGMDWHHDERERSEYHRGHGR